MIMMKKLLLATISVFLALGAFAQGPNGSKTYYQGADGKKGSALKTAFAGIISKHTQLSYTPGVWDGIEKVDIRDDGFILDRYSNITNYTKVKDRAGNYSGEGDCYNREHSFPQDWFDRKSPMSTDLMHIIASDGKVNGNRSSLPFGETNGGKNNSANNYSKIGRSTTAGYTGSSDVFEPNDEWKGDFARIYFYMVTCYEENVSDWHCDMLIVPADKYQPFSIWAINMLLRWAKDDPVSDVEKKRNEGVYEVQNNRNPFVDYPGLEQYIWGSKKNDSFSYSNYVEPTEYVIEYGNSGSGSGDDQGGGTITPSEGSNTYQLVTSISDLEIGKGYLIVCPDKSMAMAEQGKDIRNYAAVTISGNTITTDVNETGKPYEITLGGNAGAYTLYDAKSEVYLSLTSNDNKLHSSASVSSDKEKWTISISGDAQITNKAYSERRICYNSGSPRFACYKASSSQMAVQLYKGVTATAIKHVDSKVSDNTVYDLSGRKLNNRKLNKGLYVKNGKKIIIH